MTFQTVLFALSSLLTLGCAVLIMVTRNLIHSCIYLLGTLIGVAGLYVTLGADFVASIQVLVYVGGVVILMLFAVMLTGGQDFVRLGKSGKHLIPPMGNLKSYGVGITTAVVLGMTIFHLIVAAGQYESAVAKLSFESTVERIGVLLVTDHVLAFEVVSILLLGSLIGSAIIARPARTKGHEEHP